MNGFYGGWIAEEEQSQNTHIRANEIETITKVSYHGNTHAFTKTCYHILISGK